MRTKEFDETEILKKAIDIFWEKGYNATSLHDLIEGLGIGRSSIYHAFGDKHNLYVRALELYQQEGTNRIINTLNSSASVKEAVRKMCQLTTLNLLNECRQNGCFKVNSEVEVAPHDELVNKMLCEDDKIIEEALYKAIKKDQAAGKIKAEKDPRALANFVCNTITGIRVYVKIRKDQQFFDNIVNTALTVFD